MRDDEVDRLLDTITLLEKSIADAEAELEAGDLERDDFDAIVARDHERLAAARAELGRRDSATWVPPAVRDSAPHEAPPTEIRSDSPQTPKTRRPLVVAVTVVLAAALGIGIALGIGKLTTHSSSSPTFSAAQISEIEALLPQAASLVQSGKVTEGLKVYDQILAIDPAQPQALAEAGWLTFQAGVSARSNDLASKGAAEIRASVESDPTFAPSRLFLGVVELVGARDPSAAMVQFREFLTLKPSADLAARAQPYIDQAASDLKIPVPTTQAG